MNCAPVCQDTVVWNCLVPIRSPASRYVDHLMRLVFVRALLHHDNVCELLSAPRRGVTTSALSRLHSPVHGREI